MSVIEPFDYQEQVIQDLLDWWKVPEHKGQYFMIEMATGAGKTIVFSFLAKRLFWKYPGLKILFLAHRKELISQTEDKILKVWPHCPVGVFSASLKRREIAPVTIAARDTLGPALADIPNYKPDLVIVDEAHNIPTNPESRYRKLLAELEKRNQKLMIGGLDATPYRANSGLIYGEGEFFHSVASRVSMRFLLDKGRLAPITAKCVDKKAIPDTSKVSINSGEFNQKQLESAALNMEMIDAAIDEWIKKAVNTGRKSTLFFCVSVAHAEVVQMALLARGYDFPLVTGKTPADERKTACDRFNAGRVGGILNVGVFTEGTDFPIIDCIVNFKAVNSLGLWLQMVGRGMRIHPNPDVTDCLVLDFGECIDRFGQVDIAQPPQKRSKSTEERVKDCPECETKVGVFKRKCLCGYEFEPPPSKSCGNCGEPNAPSADRCVACGFLFARHQEIAGDGELLSSKDRYKKIAITGNVIVMGMKSKTSGHQYLKVIYPFSLTKSYSRNLFIGYPSQAGAVAKAHWKSMTEPGTPVPETVDEALQIFKSNRSMFRQVSSVKIDTHDKYKPVISVQYGEQDE